jgi:hypothetical protein
MFAPRRFAVPPLGEIVSLPKTMVEVLLKFAPLNVRERPKLLDVVFVGAMLDNTGTPLVT